MVRGFFPGFSGFHLPLMNDRLNMSEIFLKGVLKPKLKKKKKKKKKKNFFSPILLALTVPSKIVAEDSLFLSENKS